MQFLLVNLFLLGVIAIAAGLLWLIGALMWKLDLPPDENPMISTIGCVAALIITYYVCKWIYGKFGKRF